MIMTKRALLISLCIILVIALITGLPLVWYYWIRPLQVDDFVLEDYAYYLEEFSSKKIVGAITNASDAREKGVAVLTDVYSKDVILGEKPFVVNYDENTDSWLISGSKPPVPFMLGGTAHIIINGSDGNVLAIWHEK